MESDRFERIVQIYKADPESVYNTWFINSDERLKAFRAIRRGVEQVIADIKAGSFGNDFRSSSLEFVLNSITEQKQVFEGAAHAFYWKPKLRIPDIYENEANKCAFGQFLENCLHGHKRGSTCSRDPEVVRPGHQGTRAGGGQHSVFLASHHPASL